MTGLTWHLVSSDVECPWGSIETRRADGTLSDVERDAGARDLALFGAEAAGDGEAAAELRRRQERDMATTGEQQDQLLAAGAGRAPWPAALEWHQRGGPSRWPAFVETSAPGVFFVDDHAVAELERILPAGSWSTARAALFDGEGLEQRTHRLLVVRPTLQLHVWESDEEGEFGLPVAVSAMPDDAARDGGLARERFGAEVAGQLLAGPSVAGELRASRVLRLRLEPVPWAADVADRVRGWRQLR